MSFIKSARRVFLMGRTVLLEIRRSEGGQVIAEFELIHMEEFADYPSARKRSSLLFIHKVKLFHSLFQYGS
jgi:hypothetical protein